MHIVLLISLFTKKFNKNVIKLLLNFYINDKIVKTKRGEIYGIKIN